MTTSKNTMIATLTTLIAFFTIQSASTAEAQVRFTEIQIDGILHGADEHAWLHWPLTTDDVPQAVFLRFLFFSFLLQDFVDDFNFIFGSSHKLHHSYFRCPRKTAPRTVHLRASWITSSEQEYSGNISHSLPGFLFRNEYVANKKSGRIDDNDVASEEPSLEDSTVRGALDLNFDEHDEDVETNKIRVSLSESIDFDDVSAASLLFRRRSSQHYFFHFFWLGHDNSTKPIFNESYRNWFVSVPTISISIPNHSVTVFYISSSNHPEMV